MNAELQQIPCCGHWIFDLDGTLTVAAHDFNAIRQRLGISGRIPILEALDKMPENQARSCMQQLEVMEREVAEKTIVAEGAHDLLQFLVQNGIKLGIVTRNSRGNAYRTLELAGLMEYFDHHVVVARDDALPKPDPAGINRLLAHWSARACDAAMVGDYLFDIQAGRSAGTQTIFVGDRTEEWVVDAHYRVPNLLKLLQRISPVIRLG